MKFKSEERIFKANDAEKHERQQGCLGIYSDVARPELNTAETDKTCETSATVYMYCISAEAEEIHAPTPIPVFEAVSQWVFMK